MVRTLTWLILIAAATYAIARYRRQGWQIWPLAAFAFLTAWLIGAHAITICPIKVDFDPTPTHRVHVRSFIPFADSIQSFANTRDRIMTGDEHQMAVDRLAEDMGVPPSEVNLDPVVHGTPISVVLKDTLGNLLRIVPFGLLAPAALGMWSWKKILMTAAVVSALIEGSQLFLGSGSLASIDDVIYNTSGAVPRLRAWMSGLVGRPSMEQVQLR